MRGFLAGAGVMLLLVAAGFFAWQSRAGRQDAIPPAPEARPALTPMGPQAVATPPAAPEKSREEKRFGRADKDDDGRITRAELMEPRRKAFAKLDANGDGRLAFEEWAVKTGEKFAGADADRSGWLNADEFATTKPKPAKRRCVC